MEPSWMNDSTDFRSHPGVESCPLPWFGEAALFALIVLVCDDLSIVLQRAPHPSPLVSIQVTKPTRQLSPFSFRYTCSANSQSDRINSSTMRCWDWHGLSCDSVERWIISFPILRVKNHTFMQVFQLSFKLNLTAYRSLTYYFNFRIFKAS